MRNNGPGVFSPRKAAWYEVVFGMWYNGSCFSVWCSKVVGDIIEVAHLFGCFTARSEGVFQ